jgi:DNA-binding MarR family transcriptional regulator
MSKEKLIKPTEPDGTRAPQRSYGVQNDENLKLLIGLTRATKTVHRRSADLFKQGGVTTSQFSVLETLYHKGPLTVNEIIESVLSTGGNITVVIQNLIKEEYVERGPHPQDQRCSLIRITPKGTEVVERIFPEHLKDLEDSFSALTSEEKSTLRNLLRKVK